MAEPDRLWRILHSLLMNTDAIYRLENAPQQLPPEQRGREAPVLGGDSVGSITPANMDGSSVQCVTASYT